MITEPEYLRDKIITSETARRMLTRVSPIYDSSYVGLWMFEAIGREYDDLWQIVKSFPDQLFAESATWGIELLERRYGIKPDDSIPIEQRRKNVIFMRDRPDHFNNAHLEQWLTLQSGGTAVVTDHVGSYLFGVSINSYYGMASLDIGKMEGYINRNKPSHMSYKVEFESRRNVDCNIGVAVHAVEVLSLRMDAVDPETLNGTV